MVNFHRHILRVLRGLADGSYIGSTPRASDLFRHQFETVVYIDKDGVASSTGGRGRPNTRAGAKFTNSPPQTTVPPTKRGDGQLNTGYNGPTGIRPPQPDVFSPIDFLTNSTGFPFGIPIQDQAQGKVPDQPPKFDGNDTSPLLSMELMIYDDLMTDIGGTARFFDQDFQNSVLFGPTPPPPAPGDNGSVQHVRFQTPNQMYG